MKAILRLKAKTHRMGDGGERGKRLIGDGKGGVEVYNLNSAT
jgi:hypothetical protein